MRASVVRDGKEQEIEARELVPGDIVRACSCSVMASSHVTRLTLAVRCRSYWKRAGPSLRTRRWAPVRLAFGMRGADAARSLADPGRLQRQVRRTGAHLYSAPLPSPCMHLCSPSPFSQSKPVLEKRAQRRNSGSSQSSRGSGVDKGPSVCSVDQSAITGESLAVDKFVGDVAYYTCGMKRGKLYAVVTCTAPQSFVGRTASLVMGACALLRGCVLPVWTRC